MEATRRRVQALRWTELGDSPPTLSFRTEHTLPASSLIAWNRLPLFIEPPVVRAQELTVNVFADLSLGIVADGPLDDELDLQQAMVSIDRLRIRFPKAHHVLPTISQERHVS